MRAGVGKPTQENKMKVGIGLGNRKGTFRKFIPRYSSPLNTRLASLFCPRGCFQKAVKNPLLNSELTRMLPKAQPGLLPEKLPELTNVEPILKSPNKHDENL